MFYYEGDDLFLYNVVCRCGVVRICRGVVMKVIMLGCFVMLMVVGVMFGGGV